MAPGTESTPEPSTPEPGPDASVDELRADIDTTRAQLGETVSALADKADVKGRAQDKAADTRKAVIHHAQVAQTKIRRNPGADAAVVLGLLAAVGLVIWLRRRNG